MRSVYGDHQRFIDTYFKTYRGKYFTGDGCRRDEDGYYWITGRVDDVINVSGHRLGTAEVESALVGDSKVAEAAVVGYPHDIKGQGIYAYVTLKAGVDASDALASELKQFVGQEIGPIAKPDVIQFAPGLPKTRSGKIMRRILRKIAEGDIVQPGRHLHPGRSVAWWTIWSRTRNDRQMLVMFVFLWLLGGHGRRLLGQAGRPQSRLLVRRPRCCCRRWAAASRLMADRSVRRCIRALIAYA